MGHDILIVDDERDICTLIAGILEDEGHTARRAHNSGEAVEAVHQRRPALVILDVWLQGSELDGLQLLDMIRREEPPVPVVMISGHGTIDTAVSAIKNGAYDFIEKPFKADRLLLVVDRAIEADRLRRENVSLRRRAGGEVAFVGSSSAAAAVRNQIEKVAPTGSRVLITGPSGAGKEAVARLIHQGSKRAEGPFVVVNCSALPAERLEIELFGMDVEGEAPRKVGLFDRKNQAPGSTPRRLRLECPLFAGEPATARDPKGATPIGFPCRLAAHCIDTAGVLEWAVGSPKRSRVVTWPQCAPGATGSRSLPPSSSTEERRVPGGDAGASAVPGLCLLRTSCPLPLRQLPVSPSVTYSAVR